MSGVAIMGSFCGAIRCLDNRCIWAYSGQSKQLDFVPLMDPFVVKCCCSSVHCSVHLSVSVCLSLSLSLFLVCLRLPVCFSLPLSVSPALVFSGLSVCLSLARSLALVSLVWLSVPSSLCVCFCLFALSVSVLLGLCLSTSCRVVCVGNTPRGNTLLIQIQFYIPNTLLSVAIITIKQKCFFAHTRSATLNNVVKLS